MKDGVEISRFFCLLLSSKVEISIINTSEITDILEVVLCCFGNFFTMSRWWLQAICLPEQENLWR